MALGVFVGGPFSSAYAINGSNSFGTVGLVRDGFRYRQSMAVQNVTGDAYGDSVIDQFYRGGNAWISLIGIEYTKCGPMAFPFSGVPGNLGSMGQVGRANASQIAGSMILTAIGGTPTQLLDAPQSLTAQQAVQEGDIDTELAAKLRELPVTMRLLPYQSGTLSTGGANVLWCQLA